ncbi:hypothetical protein GIB67_002594 [Kingdonia uniflora]|uniref:Uncharacterized protein n=1 Tax=Kingdonia uniflora TaxID=39325 RepID=A0A7J7N488_9MAGN|nr:hypothetical protein GIB67_002594 [Kingdonia uniflora]
MMWKLNMASIAIFKGDSESAIARLWKNLGFFVLRCKMVDYRWTPVAEKRGRVDPSIAVEKLWRFGHSLLGGWTARLMNGICLGVEEEKTELKRKKVELEWNVARLKTDLFMEGKRMEDLKASQVEEINTLHVKVRANLEKMAWTVSPQTVRVNQEDDNERPDGKTVKELKNIRLRIKALKAELAKERDASVSLLSLQVELEDKHEKVYFKFFEAIETAVNLARQIEEKDVEIKKVQKELAELKEHTAKLQNENDVLMVKSREADMSHYRIQALEKLVKGLN